jgi:hypothetical protein
MRTRPAFLSLIILYLLFPGSLFSQGDHEKPLRPFQLSLFPMVGTEGAAAVDYRYQLSLNIFAGVTGGVEGIEAAGFLNVNMGDMKGFQAAGFSNIVLGNVEGFQGAGFANLVYGDVKGFQGAGFLTLTSGNSQSFRGAGFANIVGGSHQGFMGSGFINVTGGDYQGFAGSGFANVTGGDAQGFFGAGFGNFTGGRLQGAQLAGFMNVAGDVNGLQAAGFLNVAATVDGAQIGFINVADTITGVPIGFLSIVKRGGYRSLEVAASDALFMNASFRIGVPLFYNIFSFGVRPFGDVTASGFGYGIGTQIELTETAGLQLEAHSTSLNEFWEWESSRTNQLTEIRATFGINTGSRLELFAGPVIYNQVIGIDAETGTDGLSLSRHHFHRSTYRDKAWEWWIGARGGLRVHIN